MDESKRAEFQLTHFSENPEFKGVATIGDESELNLVLDECNLKYRQSMLAKDMKLIDSTSYQVDF